MSKYKIEANAGNGPAECANPGSDDTGSHTHSLDDFASKAAVVGVVVVGAALIEAALIPGIILGAVAAYAPKYLPEIGERLHPLLHATVRAVYKIGRKAKSTMGEVQEHISDIAAEVEAEDVAKASEGVVIAEEQLKASQAAAGGHGKIAT